MQRHYVLIREAKIQFSDRIESAVCICVCLSLFCLSFYSLGLARFLPQCFHPDLISMQFANSIAN